ncbi:MAG: phosphomethylpyrimidine synthase ThiC, partial [Priestia megaterium]
MSKQNVSVFMKKPFPNSHKVYVQGSRQDLKVPMREIHQSPTTGSFGEEENSPVRVYDTSGVYTDPSYEINLQKGLPALREKWIAERNDVETYQGRTVQPQDNGYYDGD